MVVVVVEGQLAGWLAGGALNPPVGARIFSFLLRPTARCATESSFRRAGALVVGRLFT